MKITVKEDGYCEIKLESAETEYYYGNGFDYDKIKNGMLSGIEKSFDEEVAKLLIAGSFRKYK